MLNKKNLVTLRDADGLYDIMQCSICRLKIKCYGIYRPDKCSRCESKKMNKEKYEIHKVKIIRRKNR